MPEQSTALLTDLEKEIIARAGELWTLIHEAIPPGPARDADLGEILIHIHAIQVYIKSNAAGRAYPDEFRVLGGFLPNSHVPNYQKLRVASATEGLEELDEEAMARVVWPLHTPEHALANYRAGKQIFDEKGKRAMEDVVNPDLPPETPEEPIEDPLTPETPAQTPVPGSTMPDRRKTNPNE